MVYTFPSPVALAEVPGAVATFLLSKLVETGGVWSMPALDTLLLDLQDGYCLRLRVHIRSPRTTHTPRGNPRTLRLSVAMRWSTPSGGDCYLGHDYNRGSVTLEGISRLNITEFLASVDAAKEAAFRAVNEHKGRLRLAEFAIAEIANATGVRPTSRDRYDVARFRYDGREGCTLSVYITAAEFFVSASTMARGNGVSVSGQCDMRGASLNEIIQMVKVIEKSKEAGCLNLELEDFVGERNH